MKRGLVADAIEFAHGSLKEKSSTWPGRKSSGSAEAALWESIVVSDRMLGGPIITPNGFRVVIEVSERDGYPEYYDDEKGQRLIDKALTGDSVAKQVLCDIAAGFLEKNHELPQGLKKYIVGLLVARPRNQPQKRGQDPFANHPRNLDIACTILHVMSRGFKATRNRATEAESACSIVKQALERLGIHMSEANVEKIWERFAPNFR